jgi:ribosomal protein L20A (L18A)
MAKFRLKGTIKITYDWIIDEEVEAENEEDAVEAVLENLEPYNSFDSDTDTYMLDIDEVDESEQSEAQRMMLVGAPMLPGF